MIFSDLDGTLLDPETYSWQAAQQALERIEQLRIPLILVSSKTRAEIEAVRQSLRHGHPFVVENGAAAFWPQGYFEAPVPGATERGPYELLEWGSPYGELVEALQAASREAQCPVRGFHDMSLSEICELTHLTPEQAILAKQREYDEPFLTSPSCAPQLLETIRRRGFRWTHGGRFYHICGNNDKAVAVHALTNLYRHRFGPLTTIGLGDSWNDLPLFDAVDRAVLVRSKQPAPPGFRGAKLTREHGPAGWNEAVLEILSEMAP
ncbi:MAG: HAD-IIB family hydrolase [Bryobacteraceae bacterium]|nr:HAD-IIB family hydrolase [Bryobacteraceae bacterium]MDW8377052.1 HAD-IIB family hydrolase [Bryobacterales bacterium]